MQDYNFSQHIAYMKRNSPEMLSKDEKRNLPEGIIYTPSSKDTECLY